MHELEVSLRILRRLERMTDKQLDAARRDWLEVLEKVARAVEDGEQLPAGAAVHEHKLADQLRSNPRLLKRLRGALADDPRPKKSPDDYACGAWAARDAAGRRWENICRGIAGDRFRHDEPNKLHDYAAPPGMRVAELIAYGEFYAGAEHLGARYKTLPDAHLRKQMICTLASFLAQMSDPMVGTTDPWEEEEEEVWIDEDAASADATEPVAEQPAA